MSPSLDPSKSEKTGREHSDGADTDRSPVFAPEVYGPLVLNNVKCHGGRERKSVNNREKSFEIPLSVGYLSGYPPSVALERHV